LPAKAPTTILSLKQSLKDLSVERAIDVIDRMCAVITCQSSCCDAGFFFVDKHFTLFNPGIQRCPSDSSIYCPRGKDLDLDGNASWMFWIPYFSKFKLVSSSGSLPWSRIPADVFL